MDEFKYREDYYRPIDPLFLKNNETERCEIGNLGLLAQFCVNYCREFDQIIRLSYASLNSPPIFLNNEQRNNQPANNEANTERFVNLKMRFKEIRDDDDENRCVRNVVDNKLNADLDHGQTVIARKNERKNNTTERCLSTGDNALTFKCNWSVNVNGRNVVCGQSFKNNDQLNDHIKCHTTAELMSELNFYFKIKQKLENPI